MRIFSGIAFASAISILPVTAQAQTVEDLQRQINELKAQIQALTAAQQSQSTAATSPNPAPAPAATTPPPPQSADATPVGAPVVLASAGAAKPKKHWYEKLQIRGYTQMRYNAFLSGDDTAPSGMSRLRSVHDSGISDESSFSLRRARLIVQGNIADNVALYFQSDFASAVNSQSNGERREHFVQLRDAYVDVFLDKNHEFKFRVGQSKVPFGWENLQSSSNRLTLDRSDAINSAVPSERDLGIDFFYTPSHFQDIWDRLAKDGQKLFGNYGAFGVAVYNGQGVNRPEHNKNLMKVAMATVPIELDGLGDAFTGQVIEVGGAGMLNKIRPEVRSGGVTEENFNEKRIGLHGILYPQPFGIQAEWNWGRGPEWDSDTLAIQNKKLSGGYIQAMYNVGDIGLGKLLPYARWQRYRGGWKASTNAPRLETDEIELGVEWQFMDALELTLAYANMKRREADERRVGRAKGDLIRTQLQWSY